MRGVPLQAHVYGVMRRVVKFRSCGLSIVFRIQMELNLHRNLLIL